MTPSNSAGEPLKKNKVGLIWTLLHWAIILNFLFEIGYAAYMVFFIIAPEGGGPLWNKATTFPHDQMVTRRLYALEFWVAMAGLAIYLGITEMLPRFWLQRGPQT
jgi:hypothetical protein